MPRHESVTDEFLAELNAGFYREAELVKQASSFTETQKFMATGTYPYKVALDRVEQDWTAKR